MPRKKPVPNPVVEAIRGRGPLRYSKLYWWMWENFDVIQPTKTGRADWVTATEELSKLGFVGRKDVPLNRDNVRKTWERVVRDKAKLPQPTVAVTTPQPTYAPMDVPIEARVRRQLNMTPAKPLHTERTPPDDDSVVPKSLDPVRKI